jgi:hypothetical protein
MTLKTACKVFQNCTVVHLQKLELSVNAGTHSKHSQCSSIFNIILGLNLPHAILCLGVAIQTSSLKEQVAKGAVDGTTTDLDHG